MADYFNSKFANKNASQAKAWGMDDAKNKAQKQKKSSGPKQGICDKCKKETLVRPYRSKQSDLGEGTATFGFVTKMLCNDCAPKSRRMQDVEVPTLSNKEVKNLMKSAKKGLL